MVIFIYENENKKSKYYLDLNNKKESDQIVFDTFEKFTKIIKNTGVKSGYALFISNESEYNIGVEKTVSYIIDFMNTCHSNWDFINFSSDNNELWSAQKPLYTPMSPEWENVSKYIGEELIKKIYRIPGGAAKFSKKYSINTECPIYALNLKNINKIYETLSSLKINNLLINLLENVLKLNIYFTNSNIFKFKYQNTPAKVAYDPTFFIDLLGYPAENLIKYDNIFNIKIHESLVLYLTENEIKERFSLKINNEIVTPDFLNIDWHKSTEYDRKNGFIKIVLSLKTALFRKIFTSKKTNKNFLLSVEYLCPYKNKKISYKEKFLIKKN